MGFIPVPVPSGWTRTRDTQNSLRAGAWGEAGGWIRYPLLYQSGVGEPDLARRVGVSQGQPGGWFGGLGNYENGIGGRGMQIRLGDEGNANTLGGGMGKKQDFWGVEGS